MELNLIFTFSDNTKKEYNLNSNNFFYVEQNTELSRVHIQPLAEKDNYLISLSSADYENILTDIYSQVSTKTITSLQMISGNESQNVMYTGNFAIHTFIEIINSGWKNNLTIRVTK